MALTPDLYASPGSGQVAGCAPGMEGSRLVRCRAGGGWLVWSWVRIKRVERN